MKQLESILLKINLNEDQTNSYKNQINILTDECVARETDISSYWSNLHKKLQLLQQSIKNEQLIEVTIRENQKKIAQLEAFLEGLRNDSKQLSLQCVEYKSDLKKTNSQSAKYQQNILGIQCSIESCAGNIITVKFSFKQHQYAIITYDLIENVYALKQIAPKNPNFDALKQFLNTTNDIRGFCFAFQEFLKQKKYDILT